MKNKYVEFLKPKTIVISEEDFSFDRVKDDEIAGSTICTLISSGTEINACYLDISNWGYPKRSGYAAVFRVEHVGKNVRNFEIGDLVFCMGNHCSMQVVSEDAAVKLPANVQPEHALFTRLAGVSMATLSRTSIMPGEKIMVTGLGTVGIMALQVYSNLGYDVIAAEPDESRRAFVKALGYDSIFPAPPIDDEKYNHKIGLALECSGNEKAVMDCCSIVRPHGEVSVVGVPWKAYSNLSAFELLHAVFYNYVRLYSGWEMDLPMANSEFVHESMTKNYNLAIRLISEGKVRCDGMYAIKPYTEVQRAYDEIYNRVEKKISTILAWN